MYSKQYRPSIDLDSFHSNRLTLASRSSSHGNLASGGSGSANHIYALISQCQSSNNQANPNATATLPRPPDPSRSRSISPDPPVPLTSSSSSTSSRRRPPSPLATTLEELISIDLLRALRRAQMAPPPSAQQHQRQLSSDYCRYVSRTRMTSSSTSSSNGHPPGERPAVSPTTTPSYAASSGPSRQSPVDSLSESTLEQMRQQVRHQREKVEQER